MLEGKNPNINHLKLLAKKQNIKNAEKIIDEVEGAVNRWDKYAKDAGINKKTTQEIKRFLKI